MSAAVISPFCVFNFAVLVALLGGPWARAGVEDWDFRGGYSIDGRYTVLVEIDGASVWLQEGRRTGGVLLREVGAAFAYVVVEIEGEEHRIELAERQEHVLPVWKTVPRLPELATLPPPMIEAFRAQVGATPGISADQVEAIVADMVAKTATSPLEEALAGGVPLSAGQMDELAAAEAAVGNLLLWEERSDGSVPRVEVHRWPTRLERDPKTGATRIVPESSERANAYFAERVDRFNAAQPTGG
jgi:hypothetical protein